MEEKRIPVYGKDAENHQKRMFDWILIDGKYYMETKDRNGHMIRKPADEAITAYKQLQDKQAG